MNTVSWTLYALKKYDNILDSYLEKYGLDKMIDLEVQVNKWTGNLKRNKNLCPPSPKDKDLRRCVINKSISFIYTVDKNNIEIMSIFFNRSGHLFS